MNQPRVTSKVKPCTELKGEGKESFGEVTNCLVLLKKTTSHREWPVTGPGRT